MSASASTSTQNTSPPSITSPSLPSTTTSPTTSQSPEALRQTAEARRALEASLTNIGTSLSTQLHSRAQNLHANSKQLSKQEKEVEKATAGLRKENEKLKKVVDEGSRRVKELGNVQNWAEMLERDFLVLQETVRLANGGSISGTDDGSWTGSEWSGSEDGVERAVGNEEAPETSGDGAFEAHKVGTAMETSVTRAVDGEGDTVMDEAPSDWKGKGKGKEIEVSDPTSLVQETQDVSPVDSNPVQSSSSASV